MRRTPAGSYTAYLKSDEWRARRLWALERAHRRCQVCNGTNSLHVHHRTYERVGNEWPGDLTVLCAECHALYHEAQRIPNETAASPETTSRLPKLGAERTVLQLMAYSCEFATDAAEQLNEDDFVDSTHRTAFAALAKDPTGRSPRPYTNPEAEELLRDLEYGPEVSHASRVFSAAVARIQSRRGKRRGE